MVKRNLYISLRKDIYGGIQMRMLITQMSCYKTKKILI